MRKAAQKAGLVELNAVAAVAAARNFRIAARELGMSASALSHAIATLETRMGVKLFNRTTRSVSLTEAGEEFLSRINPALREISEAMEAVNQFRATPTGTLRINTSEGAARGLLMPFILEFHRRYPDVHVDIVTEGRMIDVVADGCDAGIRVLRCRAAGYGRGGAESRRAPDRHGRPFLYRETRATGDAARPAGA